MSLSLWPSGRISELEEAHNSWWEVAGVWSESLLLAGPLVDLNIRSLPGNQGAKEMDENPRQWLEHLR